MRDARPTELDAINRIIGEALASGAPIQEVKLRVSKELGLARVPRNSDILRLAPPGLGDAIADRLALKRIRSLSGVNVVAVMSKPWPCPHGRCAYCPSVPGVPMSYTGREPSSMRGLQSGFDPFEQVRNRIGQLERIGHRVGKVELIIQGGTFPAMPRDYQERFVKDCLDAITGSRSASLGEAKARAETAPIRNVGLTVETRPDWAREGDVDWMLHLGVTRVELGIQTLFDDIYESVGRGHTVEDVARAMRVLKDSGMKVVAHMMPGLPGSSFERDLEAFRMLFDDPKFRPDMLKIYPTLVLEGTELYERWRRGEYRPLTTEGAIELIAKVKEAIPRYVRIMRVQRDIPSHLIAAGVKKSNLRQLVLDRLRAEGKRCECIRCREVGLRGIGADPGSAEISILEYEASGGMEIFISAELPKEDALIGCLRLRIPSERAHRAEIASRRSAIIRELHVYGPALPVGGRGGGAWQHRGFGGRLVAEAERIASEEFDAEKILVTSALGTKAYYKRLGYDYDGPYMAKELG
ncbi:MAG: tRNA uridine(34) 5-carboxymethylaminomethyl modification radical SAM/GNAT enzyme Elp3 [Candidatus Bathyarchaeia archaeon]